MSSRAARKLALTLALAVAPVQGADLPAAPLSGLTLEAAIGRFSSGGRKIYFSSDLVRPSMTVQNEPAAAEAADALREILAPHGLTLRPGLNDAWLVVRDPAARPPAPDAAAPASDTSASDLRPSTSTPFAPKAVEEIVVSASRYEIEASRTTPVHTLGSVDLAVLPDIGEDPIRAIARLPGTTANDLSALAYIRGGEIRETLVRLDGLRLYDPFHLKDFQGVFSMIDPRVVSSMDVYTGAFPARYGERMSGVIDVETMSPPDSVQHEVGVSFFNSSFLSTGQFANSRGTWLASARRSNLDLLYDHFSDLPDRPQYSDIFVKLGFETGDRLAITGQLLRGNDRIALADDIDREERASARQTDAYGWIRLDHRLGGRLSGTTLVASTGVDTSRAGSSEKPGVSNGRLADIRSFSIGTLRSEWTSIIGARLLLEFGGSISSLRARYAYEDEVDFELLFDVDGAATSTSRNRSLLARPKGRDGSLFAALRIDLNSRLSAEIGARSSWQHIDGISSSSFEPRLGLRFAVSEAAAVRANFGRYFQMQGINELQLNDGVTRFFPPQRSDHLVLGFDRQFPAGPRLRIEAYEKSMSHLRPRFENLLDARVLLPELKPDRLLIAPASGKARGLEISLDGRRERLHWWGSVGFARVEDSLPEGDVKRSWDQTHTLNAGLELDLEPWTLSLGLLHRSGWPTTPIRLDDAATFPTATVAARNSARLGDYGSLDARLSRSITLESGRLTVFLEIANLANRQNSCCLEFEIGTEEDSRQLLLSERHFLPRIPSFGFHLVF